MGIVAPQGTMLYWVVALVFVFIIITVYALIKNSRKRTMEIVFKKPFYKDKPEDIKNKILNEL